MKNILNSSVTKIALGIVLGFGVIILFVLAISGSSAQAISQSEAETIALSNAKVDRSELLSLNISDDHADGQAVYHITFSSATQDYDYKIAKKDGTIISYGFKPQNNSTNSTIDPNSQNNDPSGNGSSSNAMISEDEAKAIALKDAMVDEGSLVFIRIKSDHEDGIAVYDVEFYANDTEYDYDIAKSDGQIINKDFDIEGYTPSNSDDIISLKEARQIALNRVKGATDQNITIEFDYDDGYRVYEGEIYYNGIEYEFTIDATNGKVIEWSQER